MKTNHIRKVLRNVVAVTYRHHGYRKEHIAGDDPATLIAIATDISAKLAEVIRHTEDEAQADHLLKQVDRLEHLTLKANRGGGSANWARKQ